MNFKTIGLSALVLFASLAPVHAAETTDAISPAVAQEVSNYFKTVLAEFDKLTDLSEIAFLGMLFASAFEQLAQVIEEKAKNEEFDEEIIHAQIMSTGALIMTNLVQARLERPEGLTEETSKEKEVRAALLNFCQELTA